MTQQFKARSFAIKRSVPTNAYGIWTSAQRPSVYYRWAPDAKYSKFKRFR